MSTDNYDAIVSDTYKNAGMASLGQRIREAREAAKITQAELGDFMGVSRAAVAQWENGTNAPTSNKIGKIAEKTKTSAEWLLSGSATSHIPSSQPLPEVPIDPFPKGEAMLPVMGMAECGPDGWALWNGDVIGMVARPHSLVGASKAYAVYISGDSMEPRYYAGELVHIHPGRPITIGAFVLVQIRPELEGETPRAVVKRLAKRSGSKITLEQFNPPKKIEIKADDVVSMHRVVGTGDT